MLRATWRGLETWHGQDALANWRASPRPYRKGRSSSRRPIATIINRSRVTVSCFGFPVGTGDCEINLRPCRVIADRAAQPDAALHRAILICSLWPTGGPSRRQRSRKKFQLQPPKTHFKKMTAKSWCGDTAALMSATNERYYQK